MHHREWAAKLVRQALEEAKVTIADIDCICYTKGFYPAMALTTVRGWVRH
jgi:N6-L-threonylcarbamoyladenine synthase